MNDYIISPMWFYWARVADAISLIACIFGGIGIVALIVLGVTVAVEGEDIESSDSTKLKQYIVKTLYATAVCLMLVVFVPSRNTLVEMMIAKQATYQNAEWTVERLKEMVDYIAATLKGL